MDKREGGKGDLPPQHQRGQEGGFRHYSFTVQEVQAGIESFLQYAGYQPQPPTPVGDLNSDVKAIRQGEGKTYQWVGVVRSSMEEAAEGLATLKRLKEGLGEKPDYVLVLPPINEYLLLEFLMEDKGRWFYYIKDEGFSLWMHNPQDGTTWAFVGSTKDDRFQDYLILSRMGVDFLIHQRLSYQLLAEEEEEDY